MIDTIRINDIVNRIATKFNPDKIILFGSCATNSQNEDSDIDLLIVQDTDKLKHERGFEIRMSLLGTNIPVDILIYTNTEFKEETDNRFSFIHKAMKNAKVLYERAD